MNITDCGFTDEEIEKIRYLAKLFNCQKMTIEDINNNT